ncbi:MAG: HAD-IA family hydrolase [Pseudomonadota bacterium]
MRDADIEAVIFDFGGVFTTSPVENFAVYENDHGLPERFIGSVIKTNLNDNAWARFERGEIDLDIFDSAFATETRAAGHEIRGRTLVGLLSLTFRPQMIEALVKIKTAGFKTGCITNNLPDFDSKAMLARAQDKQEVERIFGHFDHVIESSKAGVRKPEPRIYEMMLEALVVPPARAAFIDDLGVNLKPAAAMGMRTIKAPFGDISPAIEALSKATGLDL